ncbi:hypothetical protein D3C72_2068720 [compost metagenome]
MQSVGIVGRVARQSLPDEFVGTCLILDPRLATQLDKLNAALGDLGRFFGRLGTIGVHGLRLLQNGCIDQYLSGVLGQRIEPVRIHHD